MANPSSAAAARYTASKPTCSGKSVQVKWATPLTYWIWNRESGNRWSGQLYAWQPRVGYIPIGGVQTYYC